MPSGAGLVFNVKDYGAVGNGTTDDTSSISSAISSCNGVGGGVVFFPTGTYITSTQTIYSNMKFQGAGFGASILKLKKATAADLLATNSFASLTGGATQAGPSRFSIVDLTLDGNKANNASGWPLRIYGSDYKVDRVEIQNGASGGCWTEWGTGGTNMESQWSNFKIHDCSGNGLDNNGPHDSVFVNGQVFKNSAIGVHNGNNTGDGSNGSQYTNVHSWGSSQTWAWQFDNQGLACNCVAEGASSGQVNVAATNTQWMGGSVFAASGGTTGFKISGSSSRLFIVAQVLDCTTAAIDLGTGGGGSYIQIYAFSSSAGTAFIGTVHEQADVHISSTYNNVINTFHSLPASQANLGTNNIWEIKKSGGAGATYVDNVFRLHCPRYITDSNIASQNGAHFILAQALANPPSFSSGTNYGLTLDNNSATMLNGKANTGLVQYADGTRGAQLRSGSGAPTAVASDIAGDYYLRIDTPGSANQRLYVCTVTATTWVGIL